MVNISEESVATVFSEEMNESVIDIEFISEGIEVCVYIEGEFGEYVMKIHENDYYDSPRSFLAGVEMMEKFRGIVGVPDVYVVRDSQESPFGIPFYIMEFVNGLCSKDVWDFGSDAHRTLIRECGHNLGLVHSAVCDFDTFGWLGMCGDDLEIIDEFSSMDDLIGHILREEFGEPIVVDPAPEFSYRISQIECVSIAMCDQIDLSDDSVLCYSDMKYDNLIASESGDVRVLLDWEAPLVADPLFNLVKAECNLFLRHNNSDDVSSRVVEEVRDIFRESYQSVSPYSWDFSSQDVQEQVELYDLYAVLRGVKNFEDWFDESNRAEAAEFYKSRLDGYDEKYI